MNSKFVCYLFFADLLAELTAIAFGWSNVRLFTKPLLIIVLFAWFVLSSSKFSPLHYCIAAALFFSWLGDVFLLQDGSNANWFMAGLGSFLLAHIMYIVFFLRLRSKQPIRNRLNFYLFAVVAVYAASLFIFLYPHIGNLKLPVALYAITISAMLLASAHAFAGSPGIAAKFCITGAVLFVVSDSLLALNKFYHPFPAADICIMLTYGLAQFAIVKGSLLYLAAEKMQVP